MEKPEIASLAEVAARLLGHTTDGKQAVEIAKKIILEAKAACDKHNEKQN